MYILGRSAFNFASVHWRPFHLCARVETSAQRLRFPFSRILRDNGILVERNGAAKLARKSTPNKPIRRNPVRTSPLRAAFTSKEAGLYVVSRLIRRFRWPRDVCSTPLRYVTLGHVAVPNRITARNLAMHASLPRRKYDID